MPSRIDELVATAQRKAQKVEQFIALLKDPDIADLVAELTGERMSVLVPEHPHNGHVPNSYIPSVTAAIRALAPHLPRPFTIPVLVDTLKRQSFTFSRPPLEAVRDAVYFLARGKNPIFSVVEQGTGGKLSKYEYVGKLESPHDAGS